MDTKCDVTFQPKGFNLQVGKVVEVDMQVPGKGVGLSLRIEEIGDNPNDLRVRCTNVIPDGPEGVLVLTPESFKDGNAKLIISP
jgi:hypothetical protein